jgi:methyltransferase
MVKGVRGLQRLSSMVRHWLFTGLCAAVAVERLCELRWSRRHARAQSMRGGELVREPVFAWMALLHGAVLVAAPVESWLRPADWHPFVRGGAFIALGAATALRVWTLRTLGDAWSVRVTRYPDGARPVITSGPYRYIRHPNYAAVIVELAALPLAGGAWLTALVGSIANALVLARRIPLEERELGRDPRWREAMLPRPRLIPGPGPQRGTA